MSKNPTIEKLHSMRISTMASSHQHHLQNNLYTDLTPDEYLAVLTEMEWEARANARIQRRILQANFRQPAAINDVDFTTARNLEKNMFARLSALEFINKHENVIITGASGVGKSYLAQALGHHACLHEHKVLYVNTARLLNRLKLSKVDGTYTKEMKKLTKYDLLILDDFGLQAFDNHARETLMDLIEERFSTSSTIVSSQIPVSAWYDIIGEGTIADAILDRLVNSSHRIDLKGASLRKKILEAINE